MRKIFSLRGFTLIELLVVISIIAILASIGMTVYTQSQKKARDAKRKADIDAISNAYEVNYIEGATNPYKLLTTSMFSDGKIPLDPKNTSPYLYTYRSGGTNITAAVSSYAACARLEFDGTGNASDIDAGTTGALNYYCRTNQQ